MTTWMDVIILLMLIVLVLVVAALASGVQVLQEYERGVVFRLGRVLPRLKGPGLIILLPFGIDRMRKVTMQAVSINLPQDVITKDNIGIRVDMVVTSRVVDPTRAGVWFQNYLHTQAAHTHLRETFAKYDLDILLAQPERIDRELHGIIARLTNEMGVELIEVEIKDIDLPDGEQRDYAATYRQLSGEADRPFNKLIERITGGPVRGPRIFLCYRREDTEWFVRAIYDKLSAKYSREQVFHDLDSTPIGAKWTLLIRVAVAHSNVMIVSIGKCWLSMKDSDGQPRLGSPKDWVRQEIEEGLRLQIPIIPVCVDGVRMPSEDELPSSIATLASFEAVEIANSRWDDDVERLLRAIDDQISPSEEQ